jgi:alpha-tubulin suppressor-like RCC1 family protein
MNLKSKRHRLGGAAAIGALLVLSMGAGASAVVPEGGIKLRPAVAWGGNADGQLGDATNQERHTPVAVSGLLSVAQVDAGAHYGLALLTNGTVRAWGANEFGMLGDGTITSHSTPGVVTGLDNVRAVAAGSVHGLALLKDGTVRAWGNNSSGQLGIGTIGDPQLTPVRVPGLKNVRAIAARDSYSLALLTDGTVRAWGNNGSGALGNGTVGTNNPMPAPVLGLQHVRAISAGSGHALALLKNGTVMGWGANNQGQLGQGTTTVAPSPTPAPVVDLAGVAAVAAGFDHSLALLKDGTVRSWGNNADGELGIGSFGGVRNRPVNVLQLTGVRAVAAGFGTSYALSRVDDDVVRAWGANDEGQLGDGSTTRRNTPVTVQTSLDHVGSISGNNGFALAAG